MIFQFLVNILFIFSQFVSTFIYLFIYATIITRLWYNKNLSCNLIWFLKSFSKNFKTLFSHCAAHTHHQKIGFQMDCHSEAHLFLRCVADSASSLWELYQTAECHHDTQPRSHLSAYCIGRKNGFISVSRSVSHHVSCVWSSPCCCLVPRCCSSVAEWPPGRSPSPGWMWSWHNTLG